MQNALLKFLVSRSGGILTPLIAAAVGAAVAKLATFDADLASQVSPAAVTAFVAAAILAVVNHATNKSQGNEIKRIDAMMETDGSGNVTWREVRKARRAIKNEG